MRTLWRNILLAAAFFVLAGCNVWSDIEEVNPLCDLSISVVVSDMPGAPTKAVNINPGDYIGAMHDGEKMQTLRIIIVRPDGTVEHNRFMDFYGTIKKAYLEVSDVTFKVVGGERKEVYLIVNENAVQEGLSGSDELLINRNFDIYTPGSKFPVNDDVEGSDDASEWTISLYENNAQVPSAALPMSERHTFDMPLQDHHEDFWVTRAAVKFTWLFVNETGDTDYDLSKLTISKASRKEYWLPNTTQYDADYAITDYVVPNVENNDYYVYEQEISGVTIGTANNSDKPVTLDPIYLLEGKYTDAASDGKNYSMSVTLNGTEYSSYFPDLPQLPRNTHVVVVITLKNHDVTWTVDVYPYGEYWLYPGFGQ